MVKIRPVKYMFFANIFVNIDHREIDTIYNIVDLGMIHKSNSMRFLTIVNSFRVLGYQMCQKRVLVPRLSRFWPISLLILIVMRWSIEYIFVHLIVIHKSNSMRFLAIVNSFWDFGSQFAKIGPCQFWPFLALNQDFAFSYLWSKALTYVTLMKLQVMIPYFLI